jgi:hypothetical protein
MMRFRSMLCGLVVAFAACAGVSAEEDSTAPEQSVQVQTITRSIGANTETCTETFGECKVGQCELGPHDTFQRVTEVCCDASGSCTTELYRLCGC